MICSYYMYSCASGAESASCKLSLQVSCLKLKKEVSYKGSILALNDVVRQSVERRCLFAKFLKCSLRISDHLACKLFGLLKTDELWINCLVNSLVLAGCLAKIF